MFSSSIQMVEYMHFRSQNASLVAMILREHLIWISFSLYLTIFLMFKTVRLNYADTSTAQWQIFPYSIQPEQWQSLQFFSVNNEIEEITLGIKFISD